MKALSDIDRALYETKPRFAGWSRPRTARSKAQQDAIFNAARPPLRPSTAALPTKQRLTPKPPSAASTLAPSQPRSPERVLSALPTRPSSDSGVLFPATEPVRAAHARPLTTEGSQRRVVREGQRSVSSARPRAATNVASATIEPKPADTVIKPAGGNDLLAPQPATMNQASDLLANSLATELQDLDQDEGEKPVPASLQTSHPIPAPPASSEAPRPRSAAQPMARLKTSVNVAGDSAGRLQAARQEAQDRVSPKKRKPSQASTVMRAAPHPGTYTIPFTYKWPHPPSTEALTCSDKFPLFRKHLRDYRHSVSASDRRVYLCREVGPCHPTVMPRGTGKSKESFAEKGYFQQSAGLGRVICTICSRIFLNTSVLEQHYRSKAHKDEYERSLRPAPAPPSPAPPARDLLTASGSSTPSTFSYDESYDALDDVPSRGRNALLAQRPSGQMEFWWQRVKVALESDLTQVSEEQLDDIVLSLLAVDLAVDSKYADEHEDDEVPAPRLRAAAQSGAKDCKNLHGGALSKARPFIPREIRSCLMVYFRRCLELRTAPNAHVYDYMRSIFCPSQPHSSTRAGFSGAETEAVEASQKEPSWDEKVKQMSAQGAIQIMQAHALLGRRAKVTDGDLSDDDIDSPPVDDGSETLAQEMEDEGSGEDNLPEQSGQAVAEVGEVGVVEENQAAKLHARETLVLPGCLAPRLSGVSALSSFLRCVFWIKELDLSSNDLRNEGTAILCAALRCSRNALHTLKLEGNRMTSHHTAHAASYDFGRLWDGKESIQDSEAFHDPDQHLEFDGPKSRHRGFLASAKDKRSHARARLQSAQRRPFPGQPGFIGESSHGAVRESKLPDLPHNLTRDNQSPRSTSPATSTFSMRTSQLDRDESVLERGSQWGRQSQHYRRDASGWTVSPREALVDDGQSLDAAEQLSLLIQSKPTLTSLSLKDNLLGDDALSIVVLAMCSAPVLTTLDLSRNAEPSIRRGRGHQAGQALKSLLENNTSLTWLNLSWNALCETSCELVALGLRKNMTLEYLDLSWNSFGRSKAVKLLGHSLSGEKRGDDGGGIEYLNLSNNAIDEQGAFLLAGGLETNCKLKRLVLDHNQLTQPGARAIQMSGVRDEHAIVISMLDCGIARDSHAHFDTNEPAGTYRLDLSTQYAHYVLKSMLRIVHRGNAVFMPQPQMTLDGKPFTKLRITSQPDLFSALEEGVLGKDSRNTEVKLVDEALAVLPDKGILEFTMGSLWKPPRAGQPLPDALFSKLLSELSDQHLTPGAAKDTIMSVMHGNVISTEQTQQLLAIQADHNDSDFRFLILHTVFNLISDTQNRPELLQRLNTEELSRIQKYMGPTSWAFTANNPTGHYVLHLNRSTDRQVALALMAFKNREQAFEKQERAKTAGRKGGARDRALDRTWRNATYNNQPHTYDNTWALPRDGILQLDFVQITKPSDLLPHDGMHSLVISNADIVKVAAAYFSTWNKDPAGFVVAVRQLSNRYLFTCQQVKYLLLELTKGIVLKERFSKKAAATLVLQRWASKTTALCFLLWRMGIFMQLKRIPSVRDIGPQPDTAQLSEAEHKLNETRHQRYEDLRVEMIVAAYARVTDYLGFRAEIFSKLSAPEQAKVSARLGDFNLFREEVAVGVYEINLESSEQRRIMQDLIHLSQTESTPRLGTSFIETQIAYMDKTSSEEQWRDFAIPASWLKQVPLKGRINFCFCREPEVVESIKASFTGHPAWPGPEFSERAGKMWVRHMRVRIIQQKLLMRFGNQPRVAFDMLDRDGGGSLDRTEIAVGLFKLGLWLSPPEVKALMETLDEDGGGEIEFDEWEAFWKMHVDLDTGRLKKDDEVAFPAADEAMSYAMSSASGEALSNSVSLREDSSLSLDSLPTPATCTGDVVGDAKGDGIDGSGGSFGAAATDLEP